MKCLICGAEVNLPHYWKWKDGKCQHTVLCWRCRNEMSDCMPGDTMVMICKNCGRPLGHTKGDWGTYSIAWRLVNGTCTKIPLCSECKDSYKACRPTNKEMRKFFKNAEIRNEKRLK